MPIYETESYIKNPKYYYVLFLEEPMFQNEASTNKYFLCEDKNQFTFCREESQNRSFFPYLISHLKHLFQKMIKHPHR